MDRKELQGQIRKMRQNLGLTQAEMAQRIGISTLGYQRLETGRTDPRLSSTLKCLEVLQEQRAKVLGIGVNLPQIPPSISAA